MGQATVYQKHMSMLSRKGAVYRLTPARCRKVKEAGHLPQGGEARDRSPGKRRP